MGALWTPASAVTSLGELSKALELVAKALSTVASAKAHVQQLTSVISQLAKPEYVIVRAGVELLVDGKDILEHVKRAQIAFNAEEWEIFGQEIGALVAEFLLPSAAVPSVQTVIGDMRTGNWETF